VVSEEALQWVVDGDALLEKKTPRHRNPRNFHRRRRRQQTSLSAQRPSVCGS
jgi:hypothetical protein